MPATYHPVFSDLKITEGSPLRLEDNSCSICALDFEEDRSTFTHRQCGHSFHQVCLEPWMSSSTPCTCVYCRQPFEINDEFAEDLSDGHRLLLDDHKTGMLRKEQQGRKRDQAQRHAHSQSAEIPIPFFDFISQYYWDRAREQELSVDAIWHPVSSLSYGGVADAELQSRINEVKEVYYAKMLIAFYSGRMKHETQCTRTETVAEVIFEPIRGKIFSIWHAFVAPEIKQAYLTQVETVFQRFAEVNDQASSRTNLQTDVSNRSTDN